MITDPVEGQMQTPPDRAVYQSRYSPILYNN